uniref:Uncharacterized protein n=2 Tax=Neisseria meningitidis TaxID=487 RepID=C6SJD1_NEIME|nr:hypothetical protein predicted by Glimmer/Critica [Neisseria meningitidis alpha275]CBA09158.1 hypothetical protein predicted by Glimmer/Critica [Neisseria meningitidis alpha153]
MCQINVRILWHFIEGVFDLSEKMCLVLFQPL